MDEKKESMLLLRRFQFTDVSTIGEILYENLHVCWSLEDACRKAKIPKVTAIPPGTYQVVLEQSPKFGRLLPRLLDVPGYEGILIHRLNQASETEGCIGPGFTFSDNFIGHSAIAEEYLVDMIGKISKRGKVSLSIIGGYRHDA